MTINEKAINDVTINEKTVNDMTVNDMTINDMTIIDKGKSTVGETSENEESVILAVEAIGKVKERNRLFELANKRVRTIKINTFGCQMNENDSEKIMGAAREMGFVEYCDIDAGEMKPDLIVLNSCCVRENAENKLLGYLGIYKKVKELSNESIVAVCGCMMQESGVIKEIKKRYKFVDIIFGTHNIHEFPALLERTYEYRSFKQAQGNRGGKQTYKSRGGKQAHESQGDKQVHESQNGKQEHENQGGKQTHEKQGGKQAYESQGGRQTYESQGGKQTHESQNGKQISVWKDSGLIVEGLPIQRSGFPSALVSIMYGCDNYCSYCIVPYVRGRERSREPEDILREVNGLAADGYKEIMLLGQNVNSYGKSEDDFPGLLSEISKIEGIKRIRFMTSHPKDLSDKLICAIRDLPPVCEHIHLPVQSGSSEILKRMNRHYSKEDYLRLIERIRVEIPGVAITTDIIVGFPGETEEDFAETLDVVKTVGFDMAFTFIYSKRENTPAANYEQTASIDTIKDRFSRLVELQNNISMEKNMGYIGREIEVLCEGVSKSNPKRLTGRSRGGKLTHFDGGTDCIGEILTVKIDNAQPFCLEGRLISVEDP